MLRDGSLPVKHAPMCGTPQSRHLGKRKRDAGPHGARGAVGQAGQRAPLGVPPPLPDLVTFVHGPISGGAGIVFRVAKPYD